VNVQLYYAAIGDNHYNLLYDNKLSVARRRRVFVLIGHWALKNLPKRHTGAKHPRRHSLMALKNRAEVVFA
jgi:hypothetical protein